MSARTKKLEYAFFRLSLKKLAAEFFRDARHGMGGVRHLHSVFARALKLHYAVPAPIDLVRDDPASILAAIYKSFDEERRPEGAVRAGREDLMRRSLSAPGFEIEEVTQKIEAATQPSLEACI